MVFFGNIFYFSVVVVIQAAQAAIPLSLVVAVDPSRIQVGDTVQKDRIESDRHQIKVTIHQDNGK